MTLRHELRPHAWRFASMAATGSAREVACFGTRGDGKTWAALWAMILHAVSHRDAGHPLPVPWLAVTDTYQSHRLKTLRSLDNPLWQGRWILTDDAHTATFTVEGVPLVRLDLFGVEDQGAMDRLRMETCGVWFEEPAPSAVLVTSTGISEAAWGLALTSQRLASHCHPAIVTSNYPDEDHWTWQRFVVRRHPGTAYVRIPPGERATAADRAEWSRALEGRQDLMRRLLQGEPGSLALGPQVAVGFREALHVSTERLMPVEGPVVALAWDFGHTPTTIIAQELNGQIRGFVALHSEGCGTRQHLEGQVRPWLAQRAPWCLRRPEHSLLHFYDPSGDTGSQADIDSSPRLVIEQGLGGATVAGPVSWASRRDPLLATLNRLVDGRPVLTLDPVGCRPLIQALSGRWYYPQLASGELRGDLPKKPNHPWEDLGDALCYLVAGLAGTAPGVAAVPQVHLDFDPLRYHLPRVETEFPVFA